MRRSDLQGWFQAAGHLALAGCTRRTDDPLLPAAAVDRDGDRVVRPWNPRLELPLCVPRARPRHRVPDEVAERTVPQDLQRTRVVELPRVRDEPHLSPRLYPAPARRQGGRASGRAVAAARSTCCSSSRSTLPGASPPAGSASPSSEPSGPRSEATACSALPAGSRISMPTSRRLGAEPSAGPVSSSSSTPRWRWSRL